VLLIGCASTDGGSAGLTGNQAETADGGDGGACAPGAAPTNTVILTSNDPQVAGKPLTFVVAVAPAVSSYAYPSGSVSIAVDGANPATVPLIKGSAQFSPPTPLDVGDHHVVATYGGDCTYAGSASKPLEQSITATFERPLQFGIDVTQYGLK